MLYLVSPSTPMLRHMIKAGTFGAITTPATRYRVDGLPIWAADNACGPSPDFTQFGAHYPGDEKWMRWLEAMSGHRTRCLFAVIPDVVCDAGATLDRFGRLAPIARAMGYPVALAAQNGQEYLPVPWDDLDVLFLGGDTSWKLGLAAAQLTREAIERGKQVHMGRVNGGPRFAYAAGIGCSTADGKCVNVAPDKNATRPARWKARPVQGVLI
jgi:hypothetical protein